MRVFRFLPASALMSKQADFPAMNVIWASAWLELAQRVPILGNGKLGLRFGNEQLARQTVLPSKNRVRFGARHLTAVRLGAEAFFLYDRVYRRDNVEQNRIAVRKPPSQSKRVFARLGKVRVTACSYYPKLLRIMDPRLLCASISNA